MMRWRAGVILAWALGLLIGATSVGIISAQPKQEYAPKVESKKLVETALHGVDGKKVTIQQFTLPPGYVGGKHYHTGPTFVYVIRGALTIEETGKSQQTFPSGKVYVEPIGTPMVGRNVSTNDPTEIVVFQVHAEGEPLMYKAN
jgi:quercetin dioxygenase-like cupin family protein